MKALLVYSHDSGHRKLKKSIAFLKEKLSKIFDCLDVACPQNKEEAYDIELHAGEKYDALFICGGDGTLNNAINALMHAEKKPILGFFNFGTLGDFGKSFGMKGSLKKQVAVVEKGNVSDFDVGKLTTKEGSVYFGYCTGVGAFTDISYKAKRKEKKRYGKFSYYWMAIKDSFRKDKVHYRYRGNKEVEQESPFIVCLLGNYMAGMKLNAKGKTNDGKGEIFLIKRGLFNGAFNFVRKRKKPDDIVCKCAFDVGEDVAWLIDGEKGPKGPATIEILSKPLRIYSSK